MRRMYVLQLESVNESESKYTRENANAHRVPSVRGGGKHPLSPPVRLRAARRAPRRAPRALPSARAL